MILEKQVHRMSTKKITLLLLLIGLGYFSQAQSCEPPTVGIGYPFIRINNDVFTNNVLSVGEEYTLELDVMRPSVFNYTMDVDQVEWHFDDIVILGDDSRRLVFTIPPRASGSYIIKAIPLNDCGEPNPNEDPVLREVIIINPCEVNAELVRLDSGPLCADGTTYTYAMQNTLETYTWQVNGGEVVSSTGTQAEIRFNTSGNRLVTAVRNSDSGCRYTVNAVVESVPTNITGVDGVVNTCENSMQEYTLEGAENASEFNWSFPTNGLTHTFLDPARRSVRVTFNSQGTYNVSATPVNNCGSAPTYDFTLSSEETLELNETIEFADADLAAQASDELILNTCAQRTSGCEGALQEVEVEVSLDLGAEYQWGTADFAVSLDFTFTGIGTSGTLFSGSETLVINNKQPEVLFHERFEGGLEDLRKISVEVSGYSVTGDVAEAVRFQAHYHDTYLQNVERVELSAFSAQTVTGNVWDVRYDWTSSCDWVDSYQFRLLKVFENESVPEATSARWKDALVLETPHQEILLTMAEGSGSYAWQARPVGNLTGGVNNPDNLVSWPEVVQVFNFTQPDEDKNFIYSRTFTEGNRTSEQLTFADGLQRVQQQQTRLNSTQQVIATQTLQDFSGRDALQSLPAPITGKSGLGYENQFMSNGTAVYNVEDFDTGTRLNNPSSAYLDQNPGDFGYYGGTSNGLNDQVPDAQGIPYTRSVFTNDGTGRLKEQAGVGGTHGITSDHTVRYFYTKVAQGELDYMFGDQAPVAANTYKELTVDANNTTSVTYNGKDGKTIATALVIGTGNENLDGLDSRTEATKRVTENIVEEAALSENLSSSRHPMVFTIPSIIDVNYTLSPATVDEVCSSTCKTCDYVVTFILHDIDNPENTQELGAYTINAASVNCAVATTYTQNFSVSVEAGSYTLEKRVRSLNRSSITGNFFMDDHLAEVRGHYEAELATVFDPVDAYIRGEVVDLDGLYAYLETQGYTKVTGESSYYEVPVGCDGDIITIPVLDDDCEEEIDCSDLTNQDFVQYFVDYWEAQFNSGRLPEGTANPAELRDFGGVTTYEWLAYEYRSDADPIYLTPAEFNTMMRNFLQETDGGTYLYDCQLVWQIWRQQVLNYQYLRDMELNPEDLPEAGQGFIYTFNLIENFFNTLEAELKSLETDPNRQLIRQEGFYTAVPGAAEKPYLYKRFYYDAGDQRMNDCMTGYIGYYNALETTTTPCEQTNVEDQFACLPVTERHMIYQCIKFGVEPEEGDDPMNDNLAVIVDQCLETCENKRPAFRQAVIDDVHNQGLYVEGDAFVLELDPVTGINRPTGVSRDPQVFDISLCELDEMEQALVENCESYCQVDFIEDDEGNVVAVGTEEQVLNLQKVLTADFEVRVNTDGATSCVAGWDYLDYTSFEPSETLGQQMISDAESPEMLEAYRSELEEIDSIYHLLKNNVNAEQADEGKQGKTTRNGTTKTTVQQLSVNQVPDGVEYMVLRDLFESTNGQDWLNNTNWDYPNWKDPSTVTSADFADWLGITVVNGDVQEITLSGNNLTGVLNPSISDLTELRILKLQSLTQKNNISGSIPPELGDLVKLETLKLDGNQFSGPIPPELGNLLLIKDLLLSNNRLSGIIPSTIGNLLNLEILSITNTNLSGAIPPEIGNLSSLLVLRLGGSGLEGEIPAEIGNLSSLHELDVFGPGIVGAIPSEIGQLTNLTDLRLSGEIGGTLPATMANCINLEYIQLGWNQLEGDVLPEIGSFSNLRYLSLVGNSFSGPIPSELGQLSNLETLILSLNNLSGGIPDEFENLTNLRYLGLSDNLLTGNIPAFFGDFPDLENLDLQRNQIEGMIPSTLSQLTKLERLYLSGNELSGNIPAELAGLPSSTRFLMSHNQFDFGDLEPVFEPLSELSEFTYRPQNTVLGHPEIVFFTPGQTITYPFVPDGEYNIYRWEKFDGTQWLPFSTESSSGDLTITNANELDVGRYRCRVTNSLVIDLALYSYEVELVLEQNTTCFTNSLCFRFGDPLTEITIPEGFEPYVFTAEPFTCEELNTQEVVSALDFQQNAYLSGKVEAFRDEYYTQCVDATKVNDDFTVSYDLGYHHYTLYYYDRAGNLMRTVPPLGFNTTDPNNHTLVTDYHYNSLGQLVKQNSPDGGETRFYYNDLGQLRFSQNEQQVADGVYSYTKYDNLGRIIEVGESSNGLATFKSLTNNLDFPQEGAQKTVTLYTEPYSGTLESPQRYLRNRVSYTYLDEDGLDATLEDRTYTVYSYDPHGNVEWLVQRVPGLPDKRIAYTYDLISGNVLQVSYNPGNEDQFYHRYGYDEDNRITSVSTSVNGKVWDMDATYSYYPHGPLKTANIGEDNLQKLDYVYTIHGWLKALNDPEANEETSTFGKDAFAMALNYYSGDYINPNNNLGLLTATTDRDLFNGNISAWEMGTHASDGQWMRTGYQYQYDELNRIKDSRFNVFRETNGFLDREGFHADFALDANGNLQTLNRNDIDAVNFDALTYHLNAGNNQLNRVEDAVIDTELHPGDVESQTTDNYTYDQIGNLIRDTQEDMDIDWTVYGKVDALTKGNGAGTRFTYDAAGNRVKKQTTDEFGNVYATYYVRDASGNILGTYREQNVDGVTEPVSLREVPIYGSDRIGVYTPEGATENNQDGSSEVGEDQAIDSYQGVSYELENGVTLTLQPGFVFEDGVDGDNFTVSAPKAGAAALPPNVYARTLDHKQYELKDHLGNVRTVITDRKQSDVSGGTPQDFKPTIVSAAAYYPYGMDLPTVRWEEQTVIGTVEPENAPEEILGFDNYPEINIVPEPNPETGSSRSFKLTGADGSIIGLSKSLKVQAGDKISASVIGKYLVPDADALATNVPALLGAAFLNAFTGPTIVDGAAIGDLLSDWSSGAATMLGAKAPNSDDVFAGINWLAFDNDFNLVTGGYSQLTTAATNDFEQLDLADYIVEKDGYVFIYTSNESPQLSEVFFDDMTVTQEKLVPDEAYDPGLVAYRYGFNGKEKDQVGEWGLNAYDYGFRIYNPALGRFLSVDPLASEYPYYTPYQFAGNMPIAAIDLDGLEPKIITSPRVFQGKLHTADEINGILQSRYKEIMHDNFIIKDENTGLHKFDHARVSEIINNTVKERGWAAARTQFKEFKANSDAALLKWDSWLFNGQTARANLLREQELEAYFAQRQFEYKLARYQKIAEEGRVGAIVDIALGSAGVIISSISIGTSVKSGFTELSVSVFGLGFSLDQISGGVEALEAINNGIFDPSKDYKIVRGLVQEVGGDAGGVLYDISSLLVGGKSSIRNVKNISGKKLNDIVKGSDVLVNSVNTGRTTKDYLDKEY